MCIMRYRGSKFALNYMKKKNGQIKKTEKI